MGRTGRALAGLAIVLSLFGAPAVASAEESAAPPATVVLAQEPPPAPPAEQPPAGADARQRMAIGITGLVLIGVVLLSRRLRKKPVLFVKWKKS
ncbi:hypothetical protein ABT337_16260 [Saccharopolyspora hirsuta]|uniref:LPXTG cell wall anchor domain-containing protein n=1 Tax=Saccharopolyspora hirsuta TaxID=1837 RepID=A0A5M7C2B7_SACHI|nr:hypothetical protein [Saccharopolyspora hirsuta]KAA5833664.1 hypothetical protein F1721_15485 [Saccharopolyspora hirsuta]